MAVSLDPESEGRAARWFSQPLPDSREMAVPASFDDIADATVRDYFGHIWYQTCLGAVPRSWQGRRIVLH